MRTTALILLTIGLSLSAVAQIPESPNKLNSFGDREGEWTLWISESLGKTIKDSSQAMFYALIKFKNGYPVGTVSFHYKNGDLRWKGMLVSFSPFKPTDGLHHFYYRAGKKQSEICYVEGRKHGTEIAWYESGAKLYERPYIDGIVHGTEFAWYESGAKLYEKPYVDDREHGTSVQWYETGVKNMETPFFGGYRHGTDTAWFESAAKQYERPYYIGKLHGTSVSWYESGAKKSETPYIKGQQHGTARQWDENGRLTITVWENGRKVK